MHLDGLRIAHLSDFHLGQLGTSRRVVELALERARCFEPDLIALTGDYVDAPHDERHDALLTRWPVGVPVVAVLGNHDYERGEEHLAHTIKVLEASGAVVLRNAAARVSVRGCHAWVVGLEDPFSLRDDAALAFAGMPDGIRALALLAHAPVIAALGDPERSHVMLTGHTHGGQIRILPSGRLPFPGLVRWLTREQGPQRDPDLFRGWHRLGASALVISEGLGVSPLPLRFRTRPELLLIELRRTGHCCDGYRAIAAGAAVRGARPILSGEPGVD
jgi:predicted MPP superfamily phosphohydrolase